MNADDTILPTPNCFPLPASSSSHLSNPVFLERKNNNFSDPIQAQYSQGHGSYVLSDRGTLTDIGGENMPPSEGAMVSSRAKRKANVDESSPDVKKARMLPIKHSQKSFTIPPQLQGPQARHQLPPELATIKIDLNGLQSITCHSASASHFLLTTYVARQDVQLLERRFYPYLWFPGCLPYLLQKEEYKNVFGPYAAAKKVLEGVGIDCGLVALTAGKIPVLFLEGEKGRAACAAVENLMRLGVPVKPPAGSCSDEYPQRGPSSHPPPTIIPPRAAIPEPSKVNEIKFVVTHTADSFPHPENPSSATLTQAKRRPRGRPPAKSRRAPPESSKPQVQAGPPEPQKPEVQSLRLPDISDDDFYESLNNGWDNIEYNSAESVFYLPCQGSVPGPW